MQVENASVLLLLAEIHKVSYHIFYFAKNLVKYYNSVQSKLTLFFILILPEIGQCGPWASLCVGQPIILQIIQLGSA
jgi:hypothetical protein